MVYAYRRACTIFNLNRNAKLILIMRATTSVGGLSEDFYKISEN